ncbi:hypothetical protein FHS27_000555 [Rhodopirellula rubra]|uniref:Uncharacterized protein n=1 Tax=Aporhodopirellula rubra TaxID=980271 RepID=A0A7W5H449_9BACT|nr:hypothetical protein [Aporhodopirellula rubra]MBB3204788.1 hypothetical protein [Aporhodopirellula rubra]
MVHPLGDVGYSNGGYGNGGYSNGGYSKRANPSGSRPLANVSYFDKRG